MREPVCIISGVGPGTGSIMRVDLVTKAMTTLVSSSNPSAIAVDKNNIYWTTAPTKELAKDGSLFRIAKTGGNPEPLETGFGNPCELAVDDRAIYIADCSGALWRLVK